jgi:hypothetical protein
MPIEKIRAKRVDPVEGIAVEVEDGEGQGEGDRESAMRDNARIPGGQVSAR